MRELRLVPAAGVVWVVSIAVLLDARWLAVIVVAGFLVVAAVCGQLGQAIVGGVLAGVTAVVTSDRLHRARDFECGHELVGTLAATPTQTTSGTWLMRLNLPGYPVDLAVFSPKLPEGAVTGAPVTVRGHCAPTDLPGVAGVVFNGSATSLGPPAGIHAFAASVRADFAHSVQRFVPDHSQGLIPGMVLGDTSLQTALEKQAYLDTGLSHLSAVSGSNITIITVAAVLLAKALTLGPRIQVFCAAGTLAVFVCVVGFEPSVLRASVMGVVGLLAVLGSRQMEPLHGLALAVIGLILFDSDLAVSFGFALSVAATAGLVALSPLIYRALARNKWARRCPDMLLRAVAVAIAADLVTMPLVAAMTGRVLLASVPANVMSAPMVAPVTILGLIAVAVPSPLDAVPLALATPFAWWITKVATFFASVPTLSMPTLWALLLAGWLIWLIHVRKAHFLLLGLVLLLPRPGPAPVELERVVQLETISKNYVPPPGTQAIVVWEEGKPSQYPHVTREGIPILFPNRDGPVRVYEDGTQRAERGHF